MKSPLLFVTLALILSACSSAPSPTAIPTIVLDEGPLTSTARPDAPQVSGGGVIASGIVIPAREAQLAFALAGSVLKVNVAEGDEISQGEVLAELDNEIIQVEVAQAERVVRELTSPAAIALAEQALIDAREAHEDAQNRLDSFNYRRADQEAIDYYEAQLVLAQKVLDQAQEAYNSTGRFSSADPVRANATTNLYEAQRAYNRAQANLNWFTSKPSESDLALATAEVAEASAALQEAEWYLAELKGEPIPLTATGAQLTRLQQARDALKAAQHRLNQTRLLAPFPGTVTSVNVVAGEYVSPGLAILTLSDVSNLQVVTTDLSERDVPGIAVEQKVTVIVEALNAEVSGYVIVISSVADSLGGDVIYKTTIELDEFPEGLRAGMTVTVEFDPDM